MGKEKGEMHHSLHAMLTIDSNTKQNTSKSKPVAEWLQVRTAQRDFIQLQSLVHVTSASKLETPRNQPESWFTRGFIF